MSAFIFKQLTKLKVSYRNVIVYNLSYVVHIALGAAYQMHYKYSK